MIFTAKLKMSNKITWSKIQITITFVGVGLSCADDWMTDEHVENIIQDSMTMSRLSQGFQMVVPLADGWCWACNVGPTLGHCDSASDKTHQYISWEYIVGPTQYWVSWIQQNVVWETLLGQCNRVFHKSYNMVVRETLFGQRWTNMLT